MRSIFNKLLHTRSLALPEELSPVIKLGLRHSRKKESKKEYLYHNLDEHYLEDTGVVWCLTYVEGHHSLGATLLWHGS